MMYNKQPLTLFLCIRAIVQRLFRIVSLFSGNGVRLKVPEVAEGN